MTVHMETENQTQLAEMLMEQITLYTNQLEDYDKAQFAACTSCIGFVGALLSVIGGIFCSSTAAQSEFVLRRIVPALLLIIIGVITLFLYNFSMSCRRVAIFRGYLYFLEKQLNHELRKNAAIYSSFLNPKKFSSFFINKKGPVMMGIVLVIIYLACLGAAVWFAWPAGLDVMNLLYAAFAVMCTICTGIFVIALRGNDDIVKESQEACMSQFAGDEQGD